MGGVAAVADFLIESLGAAPDLEVDLLSPRMYSRAKESRRILSPRSWFRGPKISVATRNGHRIVYVGAPLAEIEGARYLPRRCLDAELEKYDRVVVVSGTPAAALIARRVRVPLILQVATWAREERVRRLAVERGWRRTALRINTLVTRLQDRLGAKRADVVLVENRAMFESVSRILPGRVALEPPGVDTDFFRPPGAEVPRTHLTMVGRLEDPRKDLPTLLRAYHAARARGIEYPLILLGRGQLPSEAREVLSQLNLMPHVVVRSDASDDELRDVLQHSRLFALSSAEEGLGIAILEAMACGVPVVSTATEGARMILAEDSRAGQLVPIGDPQMLGAALAEWLQRSDARWRQASDAARERVEIAFSARTSGSRLVEIIRRGHL